MANLPLMPKATAIWLIDNTALTFEQIADFCGMHTLEVQGIADGEVATGMIGNNPISSLQLTPEIIKICEKDPKKKLDISVKAREHINKKMKGSKYTPVAKRQDKPEAIAWILKYHPYIPETKLIKLIGTTKTTINAIKEKTHWNVKNMQPKDPVLLGLCKQIALNELVEKFRPIEEAEIK